MSTDELDDEPRPNSPEDLGWTAQACTRPAPPPIMPRPQTRALYTHPTTTKETTPMPAKTPNDDSPPETTEGPRGFAVLVSQVDDGELHGELSRTLQQLTKELSEYADQYRRAGKGSITLVLNLSADELGRVMVHGDVKMKSPKKPRTGTMFFATKGNNLSVDNPRQQKLPLQALPGTKGDTRELPAEGRAPRGI